MTYFRIRCDVYSMDSSLMKSPYDARATGYPFNKEEALAEKAITLVASCTTEESAKAVERLLNC